MAGLRSVLGLLALWVFVYVPAARTSPVLFGRDGNGGGGKVGGVASENSVCSGFGGEMLRKGGNAADAVGCCLAFSEVLCELTGNFRWLRRCSV